MRYRYDDMGFRVWKKEYLTSQQLETYYQRDAKGSILSTYYKSGTALAQDELPIYGSGRIGVQQRGASTTTYELTDHLGNVRALFRNSSNTAQVAGYTDYYPFGMPMPGRQFTQGSTYRFGYQGQFAEKDEETGLNHFEARHWDSRLDRWLAPDPAHQFWSPYLGMGNNPVSGVDPDGRKWIDAWGNHIWHNGSFTQYATEDDKMFHRALIQSPTGQEMFNHLVNSTYYFTIGLDRSSPASSKLGVNIQSHVEENGKVAYYFNSKRVPFRITLFERSLNYSRSGNNFGLSFEEALSATLAHEIRHGTDIYMAYRIGKTGVETQYKGRDSDWEVDADAIGGMVRSQIRTKNLHNELRQITRTIQPIWRTPGTINGRERWRF